jgi:hypothetical protein
LQSPWSDLLFVVGYVEIDGVGIELIFFARAAFVAIAATVVALGGVLGLHLRAFLFLGPLRSEALAADARALRAITRRSRRVLAESR